MRYLVEKADEDRPVWGGVCPYLKTIAIIGFDHFPEVKKMVV